MSLIWVDYSAQIFFLGAEFAQVFANRNGSQPAVRAKRAVLGQLRSVKIPQGNEPAIVLTGGDDSQRV